MAISEDERERRAWATRYASLVRKSGGDARLPRGERATNRLLIAGGRADLVPPGSDNRPRGR